MDELWPGLKYYLGSRGHVHKPVWKDLLAILFWFVCNLPTKQKTKQQTITK